MSVSVCGGAIESDSFEARSGDELLALPRLKDSVSAWLFWHEATQSEETTQTFAGPARGARWT